MAQATFHFPRGFLWGTATSAHQTEGNNTNNTWWAWEQESGRIINGHKSGLACDWWGGRWREDFDRAAESGQNAHRLSVEWSRIQPTPERWNEDALDHYLEMLRGLKERGMLPMVTLHHFSDPLWLVELGGWENELAVEKFAAFTRKVVSTLKDYVPYWCTINEPNVFATGGYTLGFFPPGKKDIKATMRVYSNLLKAHTAAYQVIHEMQPSARVGIAQNYRSLKPGKTWSPVDHLLSKIQSYTFNDIFPQAIRTGTMRTPIGNLRLPAARGTLDYFGLNYYTRQYITFDLRLPGEFFGRRYFRPDSALSKTGFLANEPEGMFEALKWSLTFKVPIIITENGVEDPDDTLRPTYLAEHVHQVWRAVNFNFPVRGYFHWTLVDNFEWERGWEQRYGLWELDVETQARRKRPSADFYAEICRENGISAETVARYTPDLFARMFPN